MPPNHDMETDVSQAARVRDPMGFHSPNLLADGYDICTIQELLGHKDVATTMICTHVLNRVGKGVRSPADALRNRVDSGLYGSA